MELFEAKKDIDNFKQWLSKYEDNTIDIDNIVNNFIKIRNTVKSPENDFYYWIKNKTQDDFLSFMSNKNREKEDKDKYNKLVSDGATLIYSDKDWKVYHITNYEASAKYGKGTKWCLTGSKRWADNEEEGRKFWSSYHDTLKSDFYFFINKDTKYALEVIDSSKTGTPDSFNIYNAEDHRIPYIPNAPTIDSIPVDYNINSQEDIHKILYAFANNKINWNIERSCIERVIEGELDTNNVFVTNDVDYFIEFLDDNIPDGWLEYESICDKYPDNKNPNYYKDDEVLDFIDKFGFDPLLASWGGDLPNIDFNYVSKFKSKEELFNHENYKGFNYFVAHGGSFDDGIEISQYTSYSEMLLGLNDELNLYNLDSDLKDWYYQRLHLDETFTSVDEIVLLCVYNLVDAIKHHVITIKDLSNLNLSNSFADSLKETYKVSRVQDDTESINIQSGDKTLKELGLKNMNENNEFEYDDLEEDTVKTSKGKWTNKGKEGTHGTFKTKKEADAQRKAMFANGFKEELDVNKYDSLQSLNNTYKYLKDNSNENIDGSYSTNSDKLKKVDLSSGYQVSFFRKEITDKDIKEILKIIGKKFGDTYLGLYKNNVEISYKLSKDLAIKVSHIFNQPVIWDNERDIPIKNDNYVKDKKVNYDSAIKELKELIESLYER